MEQTITKQPNSGSFKPGKEGGPGRPKGLKNRKTIDREKHIEWMRDLVAKRVKTLTTAQMALAIGTIKVMRIDTEIIGEGKNEKRIKKRPVLVEDTEEIINALDFYYAHGDDPNDDETYYFVTTKDPENKAIDSLFDRTFGKPKESVAVQHSGSIGLADLLGKGALDTEEDEQP